MALPKVLLTLTQPHWTKRGGKVYALTFTEAGAVAGVLACSILLNPHLGLQGRNYHPFHKEAEGHTSYTQSQQLVRGRAWIQIGVHVIPEALLILLTSKAAKLFGGISIPHIIFIYLFILKKKKNSSQSFSL